MIYRSWATDPKPDLRADLTLPRNLERLEHITAAPSLAWASSRVSAALQADG